MCRLRHGLKILGYSRSSLHLTTNTLIQAAFVPLYYCRRLTGLPLSLLLPILSSHTLFSHRGWSKVLSLLPKAVLWLVFLLRLKNPYGGCKGLAPFDRCFLTYLLPSSLSFCCFGFCAFPRTPRHVPAQNLAKVHSDVSSA